MFNHNATTAEQTIFLHFNSWPLSVSDHRPSTKSTRVKQKLNIEFLQSTELGNGSCNAGKNPRLNLGDGRWHWIQAMKPFVSILELPWLRDQILDQKRVIQGLS
jgi:hypothetical protein